MYGRMDENGYTVDATILYVVTDLRNNVALKYTTITYTETLDTEQWMILPSAILRKRWVTHGVHFPEFANRKSFWGRIVMASKLRCSKNTKLTPRGSQAASLRSCSDLAKRLRFASQTITISTRCPLDFPLSLKVAHDVRMEVLGRSSTLHSGAHLIMILEHQNVSKSAETPAFSLCTFTDMPGIPASIECLLRLDSLG